LCEAECKALIERYAEIQNNRPIAENAARTGHPEFDKRRFPLLPAYDLCLKCSHLFNILDARGAISVTERVGVIARVRALAVGIAKAAVDQQSPAAAKDDEESAVAPRPKIKKEKMAPVGS